MVKELANYLQDADWEVEVVDGYPHHPHGVVFPNI